MIFVRTFFAAVLLLTPSLAVAAPQCKANGCGPDGFIGRLVTNHFFHQCGFKDCCDSHDVCYGRCLDCGDLHGRPECNDRAKRAARKSVCDDALYATSTASTPTNFCAKDSHLPIGPRSA